MFHHTSFPNKNSADEDKRKKQLQQSKITIIQHQHSPQGLLEFVRCLYQSALAELCLLYRSFPLFRRLFFLSCTLLAVTHSDSPEQKKGGHCGRHPHLVPCAHAQSRVRKLSAHFCGYLISAYSLNFRI